MSRNVKLNEIDQFALAVTVAEASINDAILEGIRELNEKTELEPAIQDILFDPNETPHGPTEEVDILTAKVIVRGERTVGGFLLKGKSFPKVKAHHIDHQIMRARRIPDLGLMTLVAVGDIQDSAQTDFIQSALDAKCDYLIIDAIDCARLLLAYEKICPKDGTAYDAIGMCREGHQLDDGIGLELEVPERIRYEIPRLQDVSDGTAKRYSGFVLVDRHYSREVLREVIREATERIRNSAYYRNARVKARWTGTRAHVVWIFLAGDLADMRNANWLARTQWIDPELEERARPAALNGDETLEAIEIVWNDSYDQMKEFYGSHSGEKGEVVSELEELVDRLSEIGKRVIAEYRKCREGHFSAEELVSHLDRFRAEADELYQRSGNVPFPPDDVAEYEQVCQNLFADVDTMLLYLSEDGLAQWPESNRRLLMNHTIEDFQRNLEKVRYEREKLN